MCGFEPASVLDAGCGTGRVAIELAARSIDVVGVDLDDDMLAEARRKAPGLTWIHGDLHDDSLDVLGDRQFDVVVMAGNVMIFVAPGTEVSSGCKPRTVRAPRRRADRRIPNQPRLHRRRVRRRLRQGWVGQGRPLRHMGGKPGDRSGQLRRQRPSSTVNS